MIQLVMQVMNAERTALEDYFVAIFARNHAMNANLKISLANKN
jgi:hypothetical protein